MNPFDFQAYRLPPGTVGKLAPRKAPSRRYRGAFLRGPIPWRWVATAIALPGRALPVAMALWLEAGLKKSLTVPFNHARLRDHGVSPRASRRALAQLERAGLVEVTRPAGRNLSVRILEPDEIAPTVAPSAPAR